MTLSLSSLILLHFLLKGTEAKEKTYNENRFFYHKLKCNQKFQIFYVRHN